MCVCVSCVVCVCVCVYSATHAWDAGGLCHYNHRHTWLFCSILYSMLQCYIASIICYSTT